MKVMGIDPGASGAVCIIEAGNPKPEYIKLKETERDVWDFIQEHDPDYAVLERVSAMPKQGVSSTFKFGTSFGFCRGLLIASNTSFVLITPREWQTNMRCLSKGDKNVTKQKAQELFPEVKVTHAIADALLIASYCGRNVRDLFGLT